MQTLLEYAVLAFGNELHTHTHTHKQRAMLACTGRTNQIRGREHAHMAAVKSEVVIVGSNFLEKIKIYFFLEQRIYKYDS